MGPSPRATCDGSSRGSAPRCGGARAVSWFVLLVLLVLLGGLAALASSALTPWDAGADETAALLAAHAISGVQLIPLAFSSVILRRAIRGDGVHLPGLHRAVRPLWWSAAAAVVAVPVLAVAVAVADPERPLLLVPLLVVVPGYLLAIQVLGLSRLHLGDIPARGLRGARR